MLHDRTTRYKVGWQGMASSFNPLEEKRKEQIEITGFAKQHRLLCSDLGLGNLLFLYCPGRAYAPEVRAVDGCVYRSDLEKEKRFQVFKDIVTRIDAFNITKEKPFKLGVNKFEDLTNEEFRSTYNRYKDHVCLNRSPFKYENVTAVPSTMDCRKKGAATPIKNQGQCGCYWAFSAVMAMEGNHEFSTGRLVSLSKQELVNCYVHGMDQGCQGGWMDSAFQFVLGHGLTTETSYPYKGVHGKCNVKGGKPILQCISPDTRMSPPTAIAHY